MSESVLDQSNQHLVREAFCQAAEWQRRAAEIAMAAAEDARRPSILLRPRLSIDGSQWCALYGENLQEGVAGFGKSPEAAMLDFDRCYGADLAARTPPPPPPIDLSAQEGADLIDALVARAHDCRAMAGTLFKDAGETTVAELHSTAERADALAAKLVGRAECLAKTGTQIAVPPNDRAVMILTARLAELEQAEDKLLALEAAGVDNWEGYSTAMRSMDEDEDKGEG